MAITNHERIGKCLEQLAAGLRPFVERELKNNYHDEWFAETRKTLSATQVDFLGTPDKPEWDIASLLATLWNQWNDVFKKVLGHTERSLVSELRDVRNKWAHQRPFTTDDAYRALDSMERLLNAVSAPKETEEIARHKAELLRVKFDEQARHERRKVAATVLEGQSVAGLRPWREIVTPHPDVASGRYQQAEFAADLWQVYKGRATSEYSDPIEFFRRTFLAVGLKDLLVRAIRRLAGQGSDPVVELQTNFGGGKTHSMLALYHLFSGRDRKDFPGLEGVFEEAHCDLTKGVHRVVIVGNKISPGQPEKKDDGTVVRTLWGELAWQLGGKEGYAMVKQADETATNPGDAIGNLLRKYSPCLILIDEWVAYARQLHEQKDLPGGDFETHFTFAQTLSEEAKAAPQAMLVISVPASSDAGTASPSAGVHDEEVGGARGRQALIALKNAIGRVEASWRPANAEESFEIVRRRLFQPISDPAMFTARDNVAKAFCELYRSQHQEFPPECREADYERKIKAAYPIHPEIFERLYQDWSGLVKFQRTRGVLRLMASVIHALWEQGDKSPLIQPAHVPLLDQRVISEIIHFLPDGWEAVIEKDVDGESSLPLKLDREKPNLGRHSACRRVARTLFLASAPMPGAANRGVEDRRIKLGCVQPGESPAIFGDALRHLAQGATYLYQENARYWYSTQPTVTKLAEDRAEQLKRDSDGIAEEIKKRAQEDLRSRGDFSAVRVFPKNSGEIPDEMEIQLVVLGVEHPYAREGTNPAQIEAQAILDTRGNSPRLFKNALVFLAADRTRLAELDQAMRFYLAWDSIENDKEQLGLDGFQLRQVVNQKTTWNTAIKGRLGETYCWLLFPTQPTPQAAIEWQAAKLSGPDTLAVRASRKLKSDTQLAAQYAPTLLRQDLDKIPLWRGNHASVKQLAEDYAKYPYLQRLRSPEVLVTGIQDGLSRTTWTTETFAIADAWDEKQQRYIGLRGNCHVSLDMDSPALLVKPEVAVRQMQADKPTSTGNAEPARPLPSSGGMQPGGEAVTSTTTQPGKPTRFFGSVKLDPARLNRDAAQVSAEVLQHLTSLVGSDVEVTMEIQARVSDGIPENVIRTVSENCKTLKFHIQGFEKD
ncbi:MAG TPA: Swt1 family HEPN domain-containing protein [Candidatus Sulfotelmatobacter sp.]|nr:Swt1 family HEPN domain-containing protein [Candidatus Sulfotelmatobacter sp.]